MNFKIGIAAVSVAAALFSSGVWAATTPAEAGLLAQGDAQWAEGRVNEARTSFEQAVKAEPRSVDAHMKLAGLLFSNRNYSEAIRTYQKSISLDGNNARAWMGLGLAYRHTSQPELAKAAFDEAVRIDPNRKAMLAQLAEKPLDKPAK